MELLSPEAFLAQATRVFVDLIRSKDRTSSSYNPPRFFSGHRAEEDECMQYREMVFRPEMSREKEVARTLLASFRAEDRRCLLTMIILALHEDDHVFLIGRFIELDPEIVRTNTPILYWAIFVQNLPLVQLLLDNGVDIECGRDNDFAATPLEFAICCPAHSCGVQYNNNASRDPCFLAGVKLLVEFGADTADAFTYVEQRQHSIYVSDSALAYYETMCPTIKNTIAEADPFLFPLLK